MNWKDDPDRRPQVSRMAKVKARRSSGPTSSAAGGETDGTAVSRDNAACASPPERTIVLYRRNLLRSVRNSGELDEAIRRTLMHEVGHLRGEDDGSLRDRGLE